MTYDEYEAQKLKQLYAEATHKKKELETTFYGDTAQRQYHMNARQQGKAADIAARQAQYHASIDKLVGDVSATREIFNKPKGKKMALYKYTVDGKEVYGKQLAIDGTNWVMKGVDGSIAVIGMRDATEVLPYSVQVRFLADAEGARMYQYIAKEGELAVGDLVWIEGTSGLAAVMALDTKAKSATKPLRGWKLSGSPLTVVKTQDAD